MYNNIHVSCIFSLYRSLPAVLPSERAIVQLLDDLPSEPDISCSDEDSGDDETYVPREERNVYTSDEDDEADEEMGGMGVVVGGEGDARED